MSRQVLISVVLTGLFSSLVSSVAPAQQAAPRRESNDAGSVQVWGGPTFTRGSEGVTLANSYTPVLDNFTSTGRAGHTLRLDDGTGVGLEFGLDYFPAEHLGLQVAVGYDRRELAGPSSPYAVHLEYEPRYPPGYVQGPVAIDTSVPWPDGSAEVRQWTLSVNGVGRWRVGRHAAHVSAGLSRFRVDGSIQPFAYSSYWLGGHSVVFSERYEIALSSDAASSFGVNAGGGLDLRLARGLWLDADLRLFRGPRLSARLTASEILNESELVSPAPMGTIHERLAPAPLELSPNRLRLRLGLKASF